MPEEFDPAWEYFVGDEEVREILDQAAGWDGHGFRMSDSVSEGFCFGRPGRVYPKTRLAREKPTPYTENVKPRECPTCRTLFLPRDRHDLRVYCRPKCRRYHKERTLSPVTCRGCEKTFQPRYAVSVYCSVRCCAAHRGVTLRGPRAAWKKQDKTCPTCTNPFRPKRQEQVYCSRTCFPRPGKKRVKTPARLDCVVCGVSFRPARPDRVCCSRKCGAVLGHSRRESST